VNVEFFCKNVGDKPSRDARLGKLGGDVGIKNRLVSSTHQAKLAHQPTKLPLHNHQCYQTWTGTSQTSQLDQFQGGL
jgi:hypothetical protein